LILQITANPEDRADLRALSFEPALQAALFTSLSWEIAKQFFGWYVMHFGRFSMLYGSLSTLAIFFFWIYCPSAILLLRGEVAYSLQQSKNRINI
jgi:membrane protein